MPLPIEAEMDTVSVVLVGSFNPAIFQPLWFAAHEMLSIEDAEAAEFGLVHPEITQFSTRQFRITVEQTKFIATCEAIHRNVVRDLVISCFGRVLIHTPVVMLGLNRELHFSCGTEEQRSQFGLRLAPLEPWGQWGEEIRQSWANPAAPIGPGGPAHGGMIRIQMREQPRPDGYSGWIQADIQPSQLIRAGSGIYISVNNHFNIQRDQAHPAQEAVETLERAWEVAMAKAEDIIAGVMTSAVRRE